MSNERLYPTHKARQWLDYTLHIVSTQFCTSTIANGNTYEFCVNNMRAQKILCPYLPANLKNSLGLILQDFPNLKITQLLIGLR